MRVPEWLASKVGRQAAEDVEQHRGELEGQTRRLDRAGTPEGREQVGGCGCESRCVRAGVWVGVRAGVVTRGGWRKGGCDSLGGEVGGWRKGGCVSLLLCDSGSDEDACREDADNRREGLDLLDRLWELGICEHADDDGKEDDLWKERGKAMVGEGGRRWAKVGEGWLRWAKA